MRDRITAKQIADTSIALSEAISKPSRALFIKQCTEIAKQQAKLNASNIMQFKHNGSHFMLEGDVYTPLAPRLDSSLVAEYEEALQFFITDVEDLLNQFKYALTDLFRIAVTHEDLYELLPECFYTTLDNLTFKAIRVGDMDMDAAKKYKEQYNDLFDQIIVRLFYGDMH